MIRHFFLILSFLFHLQLFFARNLITKSSTFLEAENPISDFKCGNWCGINNGALFNSCKNVCFSNRVLTAACLACLPAKDEIDLACAHHDICGHLKVGDTSCGNRLNSCECDMRLVEATKSGTHLTGPCSNIINRTLIRAAFTLLPCGCRYSKKILWKTIRWSMCVPNIVCKTTGGF